MTEEIAMKTTETNSQNIEKTTFDTLLYIIRSKVIILPQFIGSSNRKFNNVILADMNLDASLENTLGGYEHLFECDDYFETLIGDEIFFNEMYAISEIIKSYSELMNEGNEEAGINLMTMLFRIYQKTGKLKKRYYSTLNKLFATNNYAASYFLALDWIVHSDKGLQDDFIVKRGYELMLQLSKKGNWIANSYYKEKECYEKTNKLYKEAYGHDLQ